MAILSHTTLHRMHQIQHGQTMLLGELSPRRSWMNKTWRKSKNVLMFGIGHPQTNMRSTSTNNLQYLNPSTISRKNLRLFMYVEILPVPHPTNWIFTLNRLRVESSLQTTKLLRSCISISREFTLSATALYMDSRDPTSELNYAHSPSKDVKWLDSVSK